MSLIETILKFILSLGGFFAGRKSGEEAKEGEHDKEAIKNVQKSKGALARLNDDLRDKLRDKYSNDK